MGDTSKPSTEHHNSPLKNINDQNPDAPMKTSFLRRFLSISIRVITFPILLGMRILYLVQQSLNWIRFRYIDFVVYPDDIFIVTYPRSGTTWLQMILYQLTTNGELDFNHISEKVPWYERFVRYEETIPNLKRPRIFKSHLRYSGIKSVPKGKCRYIYVTRNIGDVLVSYYHFYASHLGFKGNFDQFFNLFINGRVRYGGWIKHINNWETNRKKINVLFLRYEDLIRDLEKEIRKIADFCDIEILEERLPEILERCSFDYMKKYQEKFDYITEVLLEAGIDNKSFIRAGRTGTANEYLSKAQKDKIQSIIDDLPPHTQEILKTINNLEFKEEPLEAPSQQEVVYE